MSERYRNTKALIVNGNSGEGSNLQEVQRMAPEIGEMGYDIIPFHGEEDSFLQKAKRHPNLLQPYSDAAVLGGDDTIFTVASYAATTNERSHGPVIHPLAGGTQGVLTNASGTNKSPYQNNPDYVRAMLNSIASGDYTTQERHPGMILSTPQPVRIDTGREVEQFHWFAGTGGAIFELLRGIEESRSSGKNARKITGVLKLIEYIAHSAAPTSHAIINGNQTPRAHDIHVLKYPHALAHIQFPETSAQLVSIGEGEGTEYSRMRFLGQLMLAAVFGRSAPVGKEIITTRPIKPNDTVTIFQREGYAPSPQSRRVANGVIDSELVEMPAVVSIEVNHPTTRVLWGVQRRQR